MMTLLLAAPLYLLDDGTQTDTNLLSSNGDLIGRLIVGVVLFAAIMYVVYLLAKHFLPGAGNRVRRGSGLKVVEAVAVGQGSSVQMIKTPDGYILIGVTKTQITFLTRIDETLIDKEGESGGKSAKILPMSFEKHLSRFFGAKNDDSAGEDGNQTNGENGDGKSGI